MRWRRWLSRGLWLVLGLAWFPWAAGADVHREYREALQAELEDFSSPHWDRRPNEGPWPPGSGVFVPGAGPAVEAYRTQLTKVGAWTGGPVWHQMGSLPLRRAGRPTETLGVNVFFPPGPSKGTLLVVHGYLSHAANFAYTFAWFTARGWTVVTLDLPGHGMSTGPRGDVDSFAEYGDAVQLWLAWVKFQGWPGPTVVLAHSLGSSAVFEALRRPGTAHPTRVVFCAPLVRTTWYPGVSLAASWLGAWGAQAPATLNWDRFLDGETVSSHWLQALGRWQESLDDQPPLAIPLTIFAGDRDAMVDTGWNLAEYQRLVPGVAEVVLPGKDHLFVTQPRDRKAFHELLTQTVEPRTTAWSDRVSVPVTQGSGTTVDVGIDVLRARSPRGTLVFVHGYEARPEEFFPLLAALADRGWTVAAVELPGHGTSGGPRFDVADFGDYGDAVAAALGWVESQGWAGPRVVLAHSLGGAAVFEALRRPGARWPDQVVFCAPLLRTTWWGPLTWAAGLPGFPHGHWVQALEAWVRRLETQAPVGIPLTVYSGTNDTVVDGPGNRALWSRLVPGFRDIRIPGWDHWFLEEPGPREEFVERLGTDLGW